MVLMMSLVLGCHYVDDDGCYDGEEGVVEEDLVKCVYCFCGEGRVNIDVVGWYFGR